jgi:hypothetical protein
MTHSGAAIDARVNEGSMLVMELVRARVVEDGCPECLNALLAEASSLGGLPLGGEVVIIPKHWLNPQCPHGRSGLRFELAAADTCPLSEVVEGAESGDIEFEAANSRMDATKDIGYPVREHGPYGSHPMHDDFDDESGPDGSGTY